MTMTDEQVVEVLARRMGWKWNSGHWSKTLPPIDGWVMTKCKTNRDMHQLLTSRYALDPILRGLSEEEWHKLALAIVPVGSAVGIARRLLTMPTPDLARSIAGVIGGEQVKTL